MTKEFTHAKILACIAVLSALSGCATNGATDTAAEMKAENDYVTGSNLPQRRAVPRVAMTADQKEELRRQLLDSEGPPVAK